MNPKRAKFFSRLEMSVLSLVVAAPLLAQIGNVTLSGTITGPSGTPVPNAEISVRRVATGESGEVRVTRRGPTNSQISRPATMRLV
jgi:hypothetical protein